MTWESLAARGARLGRCNGFDLLRLALAVAIVAFHSYTLTHAAISGMAWQAQVAGRLVLPAFFVISGYLVAGSLDRCRGAGHFLALRALRILPALAIVVAATALVLGPLLTSLPVRGYFASPAVLAYFQNILAVPQFGLPGLFESNLRAGVVNGALWTIQLEALCYLLLAALAVVARRALTPACALLLLLLLLPLHRAVPAADFIACFAAGALLRRAARHVPLHPLGGIAALAVAFGLVADPARLAWAVLPLAYGVLWLGTRKLPEAWTRADYSYGLYLCAYPLQQTLLHWRPLAWWQVLAIALPLALAAAALLWHGVERPLLARKRTLTAWCRAVRIGYAAAPPEPISVPGRCYRRD